MQSCLFRPTDAGKLVVKRVCSANIGEIPPGRLNIGMIHRHAALPKPDKLLLCQKAERGAEADTSAFFLHPLVRTDRLVKLLPGQSASCRNNRKPADASFLTAAACLHQSILIQDRILLCPCVMMCLLRTEPAVLTTASGASIDDRTQLHIIST